MWEFRKNRGDEKLSYSSDTKGKQSFFFYSTHHRTCKYRTSSDYTHKSSPLLGPPLQMEPRWANLQLTTYVLHVNIYNMLSHVVSQPKYTIDDWPARSFRKSLNIIAVSYQCFTLCQCYTSSAFRALQFPGLRGVPVDPVVGQLTGSKGPDNGSLPVGPEDFQQVLLPAQIVAAFPRVVLVRRLAVEHQIEMVEQKNGSQQAGSKVDRPTAAKKKGCFL